MSAVEFCLDERHELDPVHHEIGHQAVDLRVFQNYADQACSSQIALAEL